MSITDDQWFQYGYEESVKEAMLQIDKQVGGELMSRINWEKFEDCRKNVPPKSLHIFEDGWACGSINVKAAIGNWLQLSKIYINYRLSIADAVAKIADAYNFEMVEVESDYNDEIKTAILLLDITKDKW